MPSYGGLQGYGGVGRGTPSGGLLLSLESLERSPERHFSSPVTHKSGASQNRGSRHGAESVVGEGNSAEPSKEREWGSEPMLGTKKVGRGEQSPECQREREGRGGVEVGRRPALRIGHVLSPGAKTGKRKLPTSRNSQYN